MVAANMDQQPFPNIPFKVFKDFVSQNFSSNVFLTTVLLVLFSLTENPDLLNLHSLQNNPLFEGGKRQGSSGWIKCLARAVEQHRAKTLLKQNKRTRALDANNLTDPIAVKLDQMAEVLKLVPIYSKKSGKVKHKLTTVSHKDIAPAHVICPVTMECNDPDCQPRALQQDTRSRDVPQATLIKGTNIHKGVHVLSGRCSHCNSKYYADHEAVNQVASQRQIVYLNSAKYLIIGQSTWVDRTFGNAVTYSFHASASAYTDYWNNAFGQIHMENSATLSQ